MAVITVVGLGPAGSELITSQARELLLHAAEKKTLWLRTRVHPAADLVPDAPTFDAIYDAATAIETVYGRIVDALIEASEQMGDIVYAVPGSPLVAESTVDQLRQRSEVEVKIEPGLSFLDLAWLRLGVDPLAVSPRLVDGRRFAVEAAGERGPLLVAQCDVEWVLSDIKLAFESETPAEVTVLKRLGLPEEEVFTVAWEDLDRAVKPDHLTSLWIAHAAAPVAFELSRVQEVAARLRRDCPWDREQTHASLSRYLIEESYELIDAIDAHSTVVVEEPDQVAVISDDADNDLIEELGDLLFQVFAHCAIAEEEGRFNIADVAQMVSDKLIERHPHVYGDVVAETSDAVMSTWESNKKAAKGRESIMDGIPRHLPSLLYAWKVLRKAQTTGVELNDDDIAGVGIGGALLLLVDESRRREVDPEEALRQAVTTIRLRFEQAENLAKADGIELTTAGPEVARRYWQQTAVEKD